MLKKDSSCRWLLSDAVMFAVVDVAIYYRHASCTNIHGKLVEPVADSWQTQQANTAAAALIHKHRRPCSSYRYTLYTIALAPRLLVSLSLDKYLVMSRWHVLLVGTIWSIYMYDLIFGAFINTYQYFYYLHHSIPAFYYTSKISTVEPSRAKWISFVCQ